MEVTILTRCSAVCRLLLVHMLDVDSLVNNTSQRVGLQYSTEQQLAGVTRVFHLTHNLHSKQLTIQHADSRN